MSTSTAWQPASVKTSPTDWLARYRSVRSFSERLAQPLTPEDCTIQSMPDVSPTRWHLAHTTWFFETFLLKPLSDYRLYDERFEYLFNSYYNSVGQQFPRHRRGMISRPGLQETLAYRAHVDDALERYLQAGAIADPQLAVLELGLNHEQQHQELILTDIKHVLFGNPLYPAYDPRLSFPASSDGSVDADLQWRAATGGIVNIGWCEAGFSFDNEQPHHTALLQPHQLAGRCVTNGEFLEFIQDGGYRRPEFWLSMGWNQVQQDAWQAPLYWVQHDGEWRHFTLAGMQPLDPRQPVCHVSYFEADAYARWAGKRLPTEFEWESAACDVEAGGLHADNVFADRLLAEGRTIHPQAENSHSTHLMGNLWQWTSSQYSPYPGFRSAAGALGEYNGKFMCNQFVLRGGSCATSSNHIRPTYRNFFPPEARWQFSGIRLASD